MKMVRSKFLAHLDLALMAISTKGVLDQSDCFVFKDGRIFTYDGDVRMNVLGIEGVSGAIPSKGLTDLLKKIPDVEIDVSQDEDGQLIIGGKNKKAGIVSEQSIVLDPTDIQMPEKWKSVSKMLMTHLRRAAETCGVDDTWGAATCVHVTGELIEATDNFRLFRWEGKTKFKEEMFLPASSVNLLSGFVPTEFAMAGGWCHFKADDAILSIRGKALDSYPDMSALCEADGSEITLPEKLAEIAMRAAVIAEGKGHQTRVSVDLRSGKGRIKSSNERGWYRETFALKYDGPDLLFDVHPAILGEIVQFSPKVIVGKNRIFTKVDDAHLVIALRTSGDDGE